MKKEQAGQKMAQLVAYVRDSLAAEGIEPGSPEAVAWLAAHGTPDPEFWSGVAADAIRAEAAAAQEPGVGSDMSEWRVPVTRTVALVVRAPNEQVAQEVALDLAWDWAPEQAAGGDQGIVHTDSATIAGSGPGWCDGEWHDGECCAASSAELDVRANVGGITEVAVTTRGLQLGTTALEPADECDGADLGGTDVVVDTPSQRPEWLYGSGCCDQWTPEHGCRWHTGRPAMSLAARDLGSEPPGQLEDPPEPVWDPGPEADDQGGMSEVDPMGDQAARDEAAYFGQDYDAEPDAGR